ncbi:hypothetical protein [Burkholderia dolosa]|uniref:hypothetical protein n=1 Tax=Burkholderia dolosa TaxID=152500 RepID=UPI001B9F5F11|nr:hypothetical protein [Burkholderia dolosa]MBR8059548.1 hypothetical protein [Burkholderia dolosa]
MNERRAARRSDIINRPSPARRRNERFRTRAWIGPLGSPNLRGPASLTPHRTVHKIEMQARIVSEQCRYSTRRFHFIKSILRHFQIAQQFRFPSEYFSIYFSA